MRQLIEFVVEYHLSQEDFKSFSAQYFVFNIMRLWPK